MINKLANKCSLVKIVQACVFAMTPWKAWQSQPRLQTSDFRPLHFKIIKNRKFQQSSIENRQSKIPTIGNRKFHVGLSPPRQYGSKSKCALLNRMAEKCFLSKVKSLLTFSLSANATIDASTKPILKSLYF